MKWHHFGLLGGVLGIGTALLVGCGSKSDDKPQQAQHVLLISIDGMHQTDLANWVRNNPNSNLAQLSATSTTYSAARTTTPSDSFPGLLSLVTGGTPKSTGVYYDDSYDRTLYAPGSGCSGNAGTETVFDESVDVDSSKIFSGGINPQNLPLAKTTNGACVPVYPHSFVKVNTIFEVVHAAGGFTAWADKHPAYDLVNGPSGTGVADLYTPEINSNIATAGVVNGVNLPATKALCDGTNSLPVTKVSNFTQCIPTVEAYDDTKVQAVVNWIDGKNADGSQGQAVPMLMGMNFQAISVSQKLPVGGYSDANGTPSTNLNQALSHTDQSIGRIVSELRKQGLYASTLIVISAKHGQSPMDKSRLAMESGGSGNATVSDPLGFINNADPNVDNQTYTNNNTTGPTQGQQYAVNGHLTTDDVGLLWLQNQSAGNVSAVLAQLQNNKSAIFADTLPAGTLFSSSIMSGAALASIYGDPTSTDPVAAARAPNIVIQPNWGTIYSGSSKKIAEHGGGTQDDTQVALMVTAPGLSAPTTVTTPVNTAQVAVTILKALGLNPSQLQAVQKEGTTALPNLY